MASPRPAVRSTLLPHPRLAPLPALVLVVATFVAAVVGLTVVTTDPGVAPPAGAAAAPATTPPATTPAATTPAATTPAATTTAPRATPPPAPAAAPRVVRPERDRVAAAAPTQFRFTGPGFTASARVCHMWDALALDPPGDPDTTVCWVRNNFGVAPGSDTATSYILGHSYANDPDTALGRLSRLASAQLVKAPVVYRDGVPTRPISVLDGSMLSLWTSNGRLDYKVRTAYGVPKPQFGLVQNIIDDRIAKRVVLVTCSVHAGRDLDYNVIVDAYLYASTSSRA